MKKYLFTLLLILSVTFTTNAQTDDNAEAFFGINTGIDFDMNAYKFDHDKYGYSYYGMSPQYNIGADFGIMASKKLRPRIELKYVNLKYGINWDSSPYQFGRTIININYIDLALHLDYQLFSSKKLQLFISPAFKYEFQLSQTISSDNWSVIDYIHPTSSAGGALSAIIKYKVTDHMGITLTPEYTIFTNSFATGNKKLFERFSINVGVEFKLN
jgi:hypothetical protein